MNKIVELLINFEEFDMDDLGVEIMSLVDSPAIEVNWMAFSEEEAKAFSEFEAHVLNTAKELGQSIDPEQIIYVDGSKAEFATLGEYLQGIRALDVLSDLTDDARDQEADVRYRYAGPSGQRAFCATLKGLNRIYSRSDITAMDNFNPGFGANGSNSYSVFKYKGGPNCQHYWEELAVYKDASGREVIVSLGPTTDEDAGQSNNRRRQSPDGSVSNNAYLMSKNWSFSTDDKMIVTGPAMIPQSLIPRKDELGNLFHVYFASDTIEKIASKFLAEGAHNTDVNHDNNVVSDNTLLESWIVEDPKNDKSTALGFNVPKGTWMTSYKINNTDTWNKIKNGELNGFSVTGSFLEKLQS